MLNSRAFFYIFPSFIFVISLAAAREKSRDLCATAEAKAARGRQARNDTPDDLSLLLILANKIFNLKL